MSSMSGRCTLTTTSRPSCSSRHDDERARYNGPLERAKQYAKDPDEVARVIAEEVLEEVVSEASKEMLKAKASEKINDLFNRD